MRGHGGLPLVTKLTLAGALLGGCAEGGEPDAAAGHGRMVDELARIADEVMGANRFLGVDALHALEDELAELPGAGWAERRHDLLVRIAVHELRLGRSEVSVSRFEQAEALLPDLPPDRRDRATLTVLFGKGLASLRLGETRNCVAHHTAESCILPIRGGGLHRDPTGSRGAMTAWLTLLDRSDVPRPTALKARWLLSIAAMTLGEYPDGIPERHRIAPEVLEAGQPFPRFTDVAPQAGLNSFNLSGGAVVDDLDGDGLLDVLTSTWDYVGGMHFFHNEGTGVFTERTAEAGLTGQLGGLNMVHADYDGDGDEDVLVLRGAWFDELGRHPNSLLRNDGSGRFTDVTFEMGLGEVHYPTQTAAWADYDHDGDLDLYVGNEAGTRRSHFPSQLFRNDGERGFVDEAAGAGVENVRYAKGVTWGDYDDDGDPDLYVSNYSGENRLYRNRGDGTFEDVAPALGVEKPVMSFPTWFWDYDNDGVLDVYVAAYLEDVAQNVASTLGLPHDGQSGRLYRGDWQGGFEDVTEAVGLDRLVTTMGANFGDLDNDGWLDLYLGTGYPSYEALTPNVMYRNVEGRSFEDVSVAGGFGHLQKGHAVAFADLDDDGDQDVFEQMGGAYRGDSFADVLYENPGHGHHWVRLRLVGTRSNRAAIGARLTVDVVEDGRARSIHRQVIGSGSFGSAPREVHVGIGRAETIDRIRVHWPLSDTMQVFEDVEPDRILEIREGDELLRERPRRPFAFPKGS